MPTPGQPTLKAALKAIFDNPSNTTDEAADQMATAINNHIEATTTIVAGTVTTGVGAGGTVVGTGAV